MKQAYERLRLLETRLTTAYHNFYLEFIEQHLGEMLTRELIEQFDRELEAKTAILFGELKPTWTHEPKHSTVKVVLNQIPAFFRLPKEFPVTLPTHVPAKAPF